MEKESDYHRKFILRFTPANDSFFVLADPVANPAPFLQLPYGEVRNVEMNVGLKKRLRNCDQGNKLLTDCVNQFFNIGYNSEDDVKKTVLQVTCTGFLPLLVECPD